MEGSRPSPPGSNFSLSDELTKVTIGMSALRSDYRALTPGSEFFLNKEFKVAMDLSSKGETANTPPPGPDFSLCDEFTEVAMGPGTGPSWSDLPIDILLTILQCLELPQAIAFASVCKTWRSAATVAGVPCSCTPWIISWANHLEKRKAQGKCSTAVTCSSYHLDVGNAYNISFPQGCFVACCGASHGWLVLVNELSNLVLYNPFTTAMVPLPPTTDFECVEAIYGSGGNLEYYRMKKSGKLYDANCLGISFYTKAVLSCSPLKCSDYIVMVIHRDGTWLSFAKAGQDKWQVASTFAGRMGDRYLDCAYHDGSFYSVTLFGLVEKWHLDELGGPRREEMVSAMPPGFILTRHMVSTPWGDLLQVCGIFELEYPDGIRFQVSKVDPDGCKKVSDNVLADHALFLGLNHSACLPTRSFPGIRPNNIYFSAPWMPHVFHLLLQLRNWGGVRKYDLKRRKFERAFCDIKELNHFEYPPHEIWFAQNL